MDRIENIKRVIAYLLAGKYDGQQIPSSLIDCQRLMRAGMNVWEPKPVPQDILDAEDAELALQREEKGVVTTSDISPLTSDIILWQGDITRLQVDAIVNAANAQALGCWSPLHNCIDNCIHSAAGIQLRKECADIMQGQLLRTGEAFITKGYNLPARHVIHTVGPIIKASPSPSQRGDVEMLNDGVFTPLSTRRGGGGEAALAQCYRSCLDLAEAHGLQSIAFCCISTGVFRFPNHRAAEIAIKTVRTYPRKSVQTVVFNVFLDKDYDIYKELF